MRRIAIAAVVAVAALGAFATPASADDEVACVSAEVSALGQPISETACLVLPL